MSALLRAWCALVVADAAPDVAHDGTIELHVVRTDFPSAGLKRWLVCDDNGNPLSFDESDLPTHTDTQGVAQ